MRSLSCLLLIVAGLPAWAQAADDPAAESPPALRFARHDAERAQAAAQSAQEMATAAATALATAQTAVEQATAAKTAGEKSVTDLAAAVKAAEAAVAAAQKAATEAAAAAKAAADDPNSDPAVVAEKKQGAEAAAAELTTAQNSLKLQLASHEKAVTAIPDLTKSLEAAQAQLKTATEAKAAADKRVADLAPIVKAAADRVAQFEATPPLAEPTQIHLTATYKHTRPFLSSRVHPSGDAVFAGAQDNTIQRFDLLFGTQTSLVAHRSWVKTFGFDPTGIRW